MLFFKKPLAELIRAGKKTQTIRLWRRAMVRIGQVAFVPGLGHVKILAVDAVASLSKLSRADARADGFDSLAALRREIKSIYGDANAIGKTLYRVRFSFPAEKVAERGSKGRAERSGAGSDAGADTGSKAGKSAERQSAEARRRVLAAFLRASSGAAAASAARTLRTRAATGRPPRIAAIKN